MTVPAIQNGLSQAFHEGSLVWVPQVETINSLTVDGTKKRITSWRQGCVEAIHTDKRDNLLLDIRIPNDSALVKSIPSSDCHLQNERDDTVDDLVRSDFLHEPGILHTLRVRYEMDAIYTYSGSILIAVNPHKPLRHLYGPRMMSQYRGVAFGELSPHVYAIAEAAYGAMMADEQRQAILISGESGAGKTESAKMVMQYLAHRVNGTSSSVINRTTSTAVPIEEQVLESNPLLEAFGNAKTARNDNSSRFGKFVEIDFDASGRVSGASIATYLLERSRVVSIRSPERSFHIFYQLLAGADQALKQTLQLQGGPQSFKYLAQSDSITLEDVDDAEAFRHTVDAMRIVGLSQDDINAILKLVAGILHLGNLEFEDFTVANEEVAKITAGSKSSLDAAAQVLGISDPATLLSSLTTRAIETANERIVKKLNAEAAAESRDSLAKTIYSRLFDWLVAAINRKIGALGGSGRTSRTIGILDIYGFEAFDYNSFEQLCINLANEKLQQAFNAHVFKGEQAEYASEGIGWSYVDFVDNQDVLDLLEGINNMNGVFSMIDEACRLPRATHTDLAHALRTKLKAHPRFGAPKRDPYAFAVEHYAGEVCYATQHLLDKNRDFVVAEHAQVMGQHSHINLLCELFGGLPTDGTETNTKKSAFMLSTVGSRFRKQLHGLITTLAECQPHFIRCIKPNPASTPGALTPTYVLEQLRAGGVLEAVRIACAGYPTRKAFLPFARRYALLLGGVGRLKELGLPITADGFVDWYAADEKALTDVVKRVLYSTGLDQWQLGRTRVFLRSGQLAVLEGARGRLLTAAAIKIQSAWRAREARQQLVTARKSATKIQAAWRAYVARKTADDLKKERAAIALQSAWRSHTARRSFLHHRNTKAATTIQANWRRYAARQHFIRETEAGRRAAERQELEARQAAAATIIQAHWRRIIAQRQAKILLKQAAKVKSLREELSNVMAERAAARASLVDMEARAVRAEGEVEALKAQVNTLQSQVDELRAAVEAARSSGSQEVDAVTKQIADLEAAHARARASLEKEIQLAKLQRAEADGRTLAAEEKLKEAQLQIEANRAQLVHATNGIEEREGVVSQLKEELAAANRTIEVTKRDLESAVMEAESNAINAICAAEERADNVVKAAQSAAASEVSALKQRLASVENDATRHADLLKDAQQKSVQLVTRVEALAARAERLEADARAAAAREAALLQELEGAKRAAAQAVSQQHEVFLSPSPMRPASRTIQQELEAAAGAINAASPARAGEAPEMMSTSHTASVAALTQAAVFPRLPLVVVWSDGVVSVRVPQAGWIIHRCLLQWAKDWPQQEVIAASRHLTSAIASAAAGSGMSTAGYWLAASLTAGAMLKVRGVGKPRFVFQLADAFLGLTDLHVALGGAVADEIPVNVALLLSEEAKRSARRRANRPVLGPMNKSPGAVSCDGFATPTSMPSPVSPSMEAELAHLGASERHWRSLLGGIANVADVLKREGVPAPAVRAVIWATLRYIDGELLNALLLRRDCCSVSAAKALQTGLGVLREVASYIGVDWAPSSEDADRALERCSQAAKFLVQGKDDCARKAARGIDVFRDLMRTCPALSFQQVHRLAEFQHDDWLGGAAGAGGMQTLVLLEAIKRLMGENSTRLKDTHPTPPATWVSFGGVAGDGLTVLSTTPSFGAPADDEEPNKGEESEDDLLVDSVAAFTLFSMQQVITRRLLLEAAQASVALPSSSPCDDEQPKTLLLHDIDKKCLEAGLPQSLVSQSGSVDGFGFLKLIKDGYV